MKEVWGNRLSENPSILDYDQGHWGLQQMGVSLTDLYDYFACRALVHGFQKTLGDTVKGALSGARTKLAGASKVVLAGQRKMVAM